MIENFNFSQETETAQNGEAESTESELAGSRDSSDDDFIPLSSTESEEAQSTDMSGIEDIQPDVSSTPSTEAELSFYSNIQERGDANIIADKSLLRLFGANGPWVKSTTTVL